MSIVIQNLSKVYGAQRALTNISFSVEAGEIVGFLGPNGAGKSTTFKITTGFLPPTHGRVSVAGFDVTEQAMEVKKVIGYLPEHNPLYLDMFVHEYLQFVGSLYGMKGKNLKDKVGQMVERCGLTGEQNKKIETLSKGYRQRVGLAQALLHEPKVLILDEPTSGLDPNQLVEIRKLIKEVSAQKTVIFSTHIMQEVEALCDRVVIINKGVIVANDRLSHLLAGKRKAAFVVEFEGDVGMVELKQIAGIDTVDRIKTGTYKIEGKEGVDIRAELFRFAADKNLSLVGLKQEQQNLESIFQELTKQPVRV
jgi:ABC-2 type transport system ATP-binding protein